jgi:excisionase family DNA binding protein
MILMEARELYEEKVYTVGEVAVIFRVPPETVRRLIRRGDLPAVRLGRTYRIPRSVIDRYFDLPALSYLSPEDLGFGMWADDDTVGDSVEYVNQIRAAEGRTLREVVEDLVSWQD